MCSAHSLHGPEIEGIADRIRRTSPVRANGWRVCVKRAGLASVSLALNNYDQVVLFEAEMLGRGYEMTILDPDEDADFVFAPPCRRA